MGRRWIIEFCAALIAACASTSSETVAVRIPPPSDDFYRESFVSSVNRLGIFRIRENDARRSSMPEMEQVLVVVSASFDGMIGVSLLKYTDDRVPGEEVEDYSIHVVLRDYNSDEFEEFGEVTKSTVQFTSYWTEAPSSEAEAVFIGLVNDNFYRQKFTDKNEALCTDGTTYYIEGRSHERHNLIARHTCDNGFSELFSHADALFDLVKARVPQVAERLGRAELAIVSDR